MGTIYLLYHEYEKEQERREEKLVGVYSSAAQAQMAKMRLRGKPGFRDHPDGFVIYEQELDKDYWEDGFITPDPQDPLSETLDYNETGHLVPRQKK